MITLFSHLSVNLPAAGAQLYRFAALRRGFGCRVAARVRRGRARRADELPLQEQGEAGQLRVETGQSAQVCVRRGEN